MKRTAYRDAPALDEQVRRAAASGTEQQRPERESARRSSSPPPLARRGARRAAAASRRRSRATTWSAPASASSRASSARSSAAAAAAKRSRSLRPAGVHAELAAGLGVDEPEVADVGQLLLARVADLDGDTSWRAATRQQRLAPVARPAEVGDDDDRARAGARPRCDASSAAPERGRADARAVSGSSPGSARAAPQQPGAAPGAAAARDRARAAEGDDPDPVARGVRDVADGERDALGDVGLAPVGGAEAHRGRDVEQRARW